MAQDFYLKAQMLHEEFQKRELHYLNTERKLNSSIMWKRDVDLPLQEYLQRIHEREKESEETYKNILKQMEELDKRTDGLSLKLEKLGILRASVITASTPNWLQRLDSNIGSNYQKVGSQSPQDVIASSVKAISTQTENSLYCEKCQSPLSTNLHFQMNDKTETVQSLNLPSHLVDETQNFSPLIESRCTMPENHKVVFEENPKTEQVQEKFSFSVELDGMQINKRTIMENEERPSEKNDTVQAVDANTFVSKSDADSINNEFDFLESDTAKMKTQQGLESSVGHDFDKAVRHPRESVSKEQVHPNSKLNTADDESEVSGFHSPHMSVASDSDEKELPLTASAAYQALLGNTVLPRKTPQIVSGSESEDDVENALASAVQRKSKSAKPKKEETPMQAAPGDRGPKPTSGNKAQSRLSKNTRKVLGLDTSSGSEVEMAVRPPPTKTVDEDSDEFGFYD